MDNEFPGNSRTVRPAATSDKSTPASEEPKLEKVVTGRVIKRKKPLGRRFIDTFFAGDGVLGYLGKEVLLPALQNLITDFVTQGVEKAVYGEVRSTGRSTYRGSSAPRTHISYDRYSNSRPVTREVVPARRPVSQPSALDIGDIIVERRIEAETICEKLLETVEEYGAATVAHLNDLLGQTSAYTDHKWGWTNLENLTIKRVREGYLLVLPEPEDLR